MPPDGQGQALEAGLRADRYLGRCGEKLHEWGARQAWGFLTRLQAGQRHAALRLVLAVPISI